LPEASGALPNAHGDGEFDGFDALLGGPLGAPVLLELAELPELDVPSGFMAGTLLTPADEPCVVAPLLD